MNDLKKPCSLKQGLSLAGLILLFDQVSKFYFIYGLDLLERPVEIFPFFKLVMVWNQGVSFGMFSSDDVSRRWVLIGLSVVIVSYLVYWLKSLDKKMLVAAVGMIIGGAVGNVVDRLVWGAVADFFYFHYQDWYWPAFNIADSAIFIGVVILCWDSMVGGSSSKDDQA